MKTFVVPSRERFRAALEALAAELPERHLGMLKEHYAEPRHTTTASRLAAAVSYRNYSAANLQYGNLAKVLGAALEQSTGDFIGLKLLVEFVMPGEQGNDEILWVMRPELAGALEDLAWVSRSHEGA